MGVKNVLIVVGVPDFDYLNEKSAVASFLTELKKAFEINGDKVDFPLKSSYTSYISKDNSLTLKDKLKKTIKNWNWLYQSLSFGQYFRKQSELIKHIPKEKKYDLIVEFYTVGSTLGMDLAKLYNVPFSVVFDSPVDEQFLEMYGTKTIYWSKIKRAEKESLEFASQIMAYSPECKLFIKDKYALKANISVLPCVINKGSTENNPKSDVFNIGFIGSFLSWHKVDMLVEAFSEFNQSHPDSRLQLIGYGKEWEAVKTQVENLKLTKKIEMPGFVGESELLEYKKNFSIAVMPGSNWYGSPLKLFEYAQCGIPFIAPNTATVKSIFSNDIHCLYIDDEDELYSLIELMEVLYNDPNKARNIGRYSREFYFKEFSEEVYLRKLYNIFC